LLALLAFAATSSHQAIPSASAGNAEQRSFQTAQADHHSPVDLRKGSRVLTQTAEARCGIAMPALESADPPTTSTVSPREQFVARDHFSRNISTAAPVKINWLGAAFTEHFASKIESDSRASVLRVHAVQTVARDIEIIAELGVQSETMLADLYCLLLLQPNGEAGALRINAKPNIFYVRDVGGRRWAVDAVWGGVGWELGASPAEGLRSPDSVVISR
jgi:hypothetical protein